MKRRLIGVAGAALAVLGCSEDPTRLSVIDESSPAPAAKAPVLLARGDDPGKDDGEKKGGESAQDAMKKGLEAAQKNDLAAAIVEFERAHKLDPKDRQVLFFLTLARQIRAGETEDAKLKSELWLRSGETARALRDLGGKEPRPQEKAIVAQALFNEACALARAGQADKAMASLAESVDSGFLDDRKLVGDEALRPLRDRPDFKKLADQVTATARAAAKKRDDAMTEQLMPEVKREMASFHSFPFSFDLPGVDGKPVKLDDFKGKVTIVDVWGTWCPPCRMEVPHFIALADAYKGKGLAVVGINKERVPPAEVKKTIESFAKEMGINYPLVVGDDKVEESIPDFSGYPTTLFIDRAGKVRYKHVGYMPYQVLDEIVKTLLADLPKS